MMRDLPETLPTAGSSVATSIAAAAIDLSAFVGRYVWLYCSALTHIRAAATAPTAVTTDVALPIGLHRFQVTEATKHVSVILASATGVVNHAPASQ